MPLVSLNHGIRKAYARILIERKTATDAALLAEALDKLVPLGLRVRADEGRDSGRSTARCPTSSIGGARGYRHTLYEGDDHDSLVDAYLTNHARSYRTEPPALGVLLYATAETTFDYRYCMHGHPLWVSAVDLAKPWPAVREGLDYLAKALSAHKGPNTQ